MAPLTNISLGGKNRRSKVKEKSLRPSNAAVACPTSGVIIFVLVHITPIIRIPNFTIEIKYVLKCFNYCWNTIC